MIKHIKFRNINDVAYDIDFKEKLTLVTGDNSDKLILPFYTLALVSNIDKACKLADESLSYLDIKYSIQGFKHSYRLLYNKNGIVYEKVDGILNIEKPTYTSILKEQHIEAITPVMLDLKNQTCIDNLRESLVEQIKKTSEYFQMYFVLYLEMFRISIEELSFDQDNQILVHFSKDLIIPLSKLAIETQLVIYTYSIFLMSRLTKHQLIYINNADMFGKEHLETFLLKALSNESYLQLIIQTNNPYFTGFVKDDKYIKPKCTLKKQILRTRMYNQQLLVNENRF